MMALYRDMLTRPPCTHTMAVLNPWRAAACYPRVLVSKVSGEGQASDGPGRAIGCPDLYNMTEAINQMNASSSGSTQSAANPRTSNSSHDSSSGSSSTETSSSPAAHSSADGTQKPEGSPVRKKQ